MYIQNRNKLRDIESKLMVTRKEEGCQDKLGAYE